MALRFARLRRIEGDREIRRDTDDAAWRRIEQGLLLALHQSGTLNAVQYRLAEEALKEQRRERSRRLTEDET